MTRLPTWCFGFGAAVILFVSLTGPADAERFLHLELLRSEPAADTTIVDPPTEIRLHFSEAPRLDGTTVRLADRDENLIGTSDPRADEDDPRQVYIAIGEDGLEQGEYTVHWRAIAEDGHAQRGTFDFTFRQE